MGNDDVFDVAYQFPEFGVSIAFLEGWFVRHHFFCDVVYGHSIDGYGLSWIEQLPDGRTIFRFEGYLAESIVWFGTRGFCVEKDEHGYPLIQAR